MAPVILLACMLLVSSYHTEGFRGERCNWRRSRCGKDTAELKEYRDGKVTPPKTIAAGANHWETSGGKAVQLELKEVPFKGA